MGGLTGWWRFGEVHGRFFTPIESKLRASSYIGALAGDWPVDQAANDEFAKASAAEDENSRA